MNKFKTLITKLFGKKIIEASIIKEERNFNYRKSELSYQECKFLEAIEIILLELNKKYKYSINYISGSLDALDLLRDFKDRLFLLYDKENYICMRTDFGVLNLSVALVIHIEAYRKDDLIITTKDLSEKSIIISIDNDGNLVKGFRYKNSISEKTDIDSILKEFDNLVQDELYTINTK